MLANVDQPWIWGDVQETAFQQSTNCCSDTSKTYKRKDILVAYKMELLEIGEVLMQMDDDAKEFIITYASWSNNNAKAPYSLCKGKCLTIILAIAHFRCYFYTYEDVNVMQFLKNREALPTWLT